MAFTAVLCKNRHHAAVYQKPPGSESRRHYGLDDTVFASLVHVGGLAVLFFLFLSFGRTRFLAIVVPTSVEVALRLSGFRKALKVSRPFLLLLLHLQCQIWFLYVSERYLMVRAPGGQYLRPQSDVSRLDRTASIAVRLPLAAEVVLTAKAQENYVTGEDFSIVIPVRNEDKYIVKTILYTLENTRENVIKEIIVVDDASDIPVATLLDRDLPANLRGLVHVLRYDAKQGLIRARISGADVAKASNIFFLDGHCRPKLGWAMPLIRHLKQNYRRIACPTVEEIDERTWENVGTSGAKMMFEWNFEFSWYDDLTNEVPISSGGILAITKRWWQESGKYDPGMLEWGGENIEQSLRTWLCGGEIVVERNSFIGHIFNRPAKPNPGNFLVTQVQKNQKRTALVWLDDYYAFFEHHHPAVKQLDPGPGLEERAALRQKLNCKPFQWFVDKFKSSFERKGLLDDDFYHIQHVQSRWCLAGKPSNLQAEHPAIRGHQHIILAPCLAFDENQMWQNVGGNRLLYHKSTGHCLDLYLGQDASYSQRVPILFPCDWTSVFKLTNKNQFFQFDSHQSGRIVSYNSRDSATLTGNDIRAVEPNRTTAPDSSCLTADLDYSTAWEWEQDNQYYEKNKIYPRNVYYSSCLPYIDNSRMWNDPQEFKALWPRTTKFQEL